MEKQRGTAYFGIVKPVVASSSLAIIRFGVNVAQLGRARIHSCPCYSLHFILKTKYSDAVVSVTSHNRVLHLTYNQTMSVRFRQYYSETFILTVIFFDTSRVRWRCSNFRSFGASIKGFCPFHGCVFT